MEPEDNTSTGASRFRSGMSPSEIVYESMRQAGVEISNSKAARSNISEDDWYNGSGERFFRGIIIGLALSMPIWIVIILSLYMIMRG